MHTPSARFLCRLRAAARIAALAGAVGSVALTLHAGWRNAPLVLLVLFSLWVLSPYVAFAFASLVSKRWPPAARAALDTVMLLLTPASLALYAAVALGPPRPKPASVFLMVPLASCMAIAVTVSIGGLRNRGRSPRSESN